MKRETLRHPKLYDLAARLQCDRPTALGYLTLLWDNTADVAIQGDIGKWPDGAISGPCDWRGEPADFIAAMVGAGWLDEHPDHRLLVHDWPDHCERWVKAKLEKLGLGFAAGYSTEPTVDATVERGTGRSPPRDRTEPNRTEPLPSGRLGVRSVNADEDWEALRPAVRELAKAVGGDRRLKRDDRELAIKAAVLADPLNGEVSKIAGDIEQQRKRGKPPDRPWGYFKTALIRVCKQAGLDFDAQWRAITIPEKLLLPPGKEKPP